MYRKACWLEAILFDGFVPMAITVLEIRASKQEINGHGNGAWGPIFPFLTTFPIPCHLINFPQAPDLRVMLIPYVDTMRHRHIIICGSTEQSVPKVLFFGHVLVYNSTTQERSTVAQACLDQKDKEGNPDEAWSVRTTTWV